MTIMFFWSKFPLEKVIARWCIAMMQQPLLLTPNFGLKSSHILTQSLYNVRVVCGIDRFACQDEFFVNSPLDVKENGEHALDFAFCLSHLVWSR
jgi:hypothetical protein